MKSIRFKLWAGMMMLVAIVLILLWFFQIIFLESFYTNMHISDIKNEGKSLSKLVSKGDKTELSYKLDVFAFDNNLSVEVLDSVGNPIYTAGSTGNSGQIPMNKNNARIDTYKSVLEGKEVSIPLSHPRFGNKFIMIGIPIKASGGVSWAMLINVPLAPVEDTTSILKQQLIFITFILVLAALLISFFLSRGFTRPILEIKKASEIMALGDFSVRINSRKQDEIGKLAETINYLGQQLSKIEQLRKDLIANVSHELRTPLSLIRGYAETIRDVSSSVPEKRDKQLGIIIEEAERLSRIVDDILNLSQLQAGYFSLNLSHFNLRELLDNIVNRYNILSEKTGINIIQQYSGDALVEADETRIEQVLYNLINNAFNHTPEYGFIKVNVIDEMDAVRIEVSDTGMGIPEEDIHHIWDRYYKAEKTGGKRSLGTGLGLAIVKEVLEAHSSVFGVESKREMGTTFWFKLRKFSL